MTRATTHTHHSIVRDFKRAAEIAAKMGAVLAVVCHFLPPTYRPICDALAQICTLGQ